MSFKGQKVLALESRRANETAELIRRNGGDPFVAPSMEEVPIEANEEAFAFADRLIRGEFDLVIFLTGVGARYLSKVVESKIARQVFVDALRKTTIAARGPKPVAAMRELGLEPALVAPEPNTWRELLGVLEGRTERRAALQEYGRPNPELIEGLRSRGIEVTPVPVYQYRMPADRTPLEEAVRALAGGNFSTVLFTTSQQVVHLFDVARDLQLEDGVREALRQAAAGSIGPTTSEMLREYLIEPSFEASHPKLGFLVKEAAERG